MNAEEVFSEWNEYAKRKQLKERRVDVKKMISSADRKIVAVSGVRRAGKSSLLILLFKRLIKEGKKAAYINLEDSRINSERDALDRAVGWFGDEGYLLLDEITAVNGWEGWLARMHEMGKGRLRLIISSSTGKLLKPPKPLRGRILLHELYPLSFVELLDFENIKSPKTVAEKGRVERKMQEYLEYGGFPEVVLSPDNTEKVKLLISYFRDIVGLDISDVSGVRPGIVELFGKYNLGSVYFSASKALNFLKSLGYKIGKETLLELEKYSQMSYLFFFVPIFSYNVKDSAQYPRKVYSGDNGFFYAITGRFNIGRAYENAVYLELRRRAGPGVEINYWKSKDGYEADFVITTGMEVSNIIQVCSDFSDKKTVRREVMGLVKAAKEFSIDKGCIITDKFEGKIRENGVEIACIPLAKWLVQKS